MSAKKYDYVIVGAGFSGSTIAERLATQTDKKVLIVEKRNHIGGNAYDYFDDAGVLVHKHGPHIFHTNSRKVFEYLSQFTEWRPYEHRVLAYVDGKLFPFPINLNTVNQFYNISLSSTDLKKFFTLVAERRVPTKSSEDVVLNKVGRHLYDKFFRNYTLKQWGVDPSEIDPAVISRIPIRTNRDDRYFTDKYQFMPLDGFTNLFKRMLAHPNIEILINTNYHDVVSEIQCKKVVYTGMIDEYFNYCFGKLDYRSLHFKYQTFTKPVYQQAAVINYPNDYEFTRITEFKYLTGQIHQNTTIAYEYPSIEGEPYYPVFNPNSIEKYEQYKNLANTAKNVVFIGRLATYKYYNMDQVVAQALTTFKKIMIDTK